MRTLLSLLGCRDLADVRGTDVLITGRTAELARLRGIDLGALARRG